jgi:ADP-glucose pyrophosphorylase
MHFFVDRLELCHVCFVLLLQIDDNRRVTSFAEKPKDAALQAMKVRT